MPVTSRRTSTSAAAARRSGSELTALVRARALGRGDQQRTNMKTTTSAFMYLGVLYVLSRRRMTLVHNIPTPPAFAFGWLAVPSPCELLLRCSACAFADVVVLTMCACIHPCAPTVRVFVRTDTYNYNQKVQQKSGVGADEDGEDARAIELTEVKSGN